jgi:hypothetical protein
MDINTTRLRCTLGWLALLLPWIVALLLWTFPPSISATYFYYESGPVFMIILGSASFLLFAYKGYDKQDDIISSISGLFGLLICLFPTTSHRGDAYIGTFQIPANISSIIHNISAVVFFTLLSYNSIFLFTKHGETMTSGKKKRNVIYRICGIGMIASFLLLLLPSFYIQIWLIEAIALLFFGVSWLTKADYYPWLFADKK